MFGWKEILLPGTTTGKNQRTRYIMLCKLTRNNKEEEQKEMEKVGPSRIEGNFRGNHSRKRILAGCLSLEGEGRWDYDGHSNLISLMFP